MQVKKFEAPTLQDALKIVRKEMGPDAIILNTRHYKRAFGLLSKGSVEVTAAITQDNWEKRRQFQARMPEELIKKVSLGSARSEKGAIERLFSFTKSKSIDRPTMPAQDVAEEKILEDTIEVSETTRILRPPSGSANPASRELERQIANLKKDLQQLRSRLADSEPENPEVRSFLFQLMAAGVPRSHAVEWIRQIASERTVIDSEVLWDGLLDILTDQIKFAPITSSRVLMAVGPSGSGKTTTLLKVAASHRKKGNRVLFLQLWWGESHSSFAKEVCSTLDIDFQNVHINAKDVAQLTVDYDSIVIDSPGVRVSKWPVEAFRCVDWFEDCALTLTLPALYRLDEMRYYRQEYKRLGISSLSLTKLDETVLGGSVVLAADLLPLGVFGTGTLIPDDLEQATIERVVSMLMTEGQK